MPLDTAPSAWFVRAGRDGVWRQRFIDTGRVYIGYGLKALPSQPTDEDIVAELQRAEPPRSAVGRLWQIRHFIGDMAPGNLVISDLYPERYGYGEISSDWSMDVRQQDGRLSRTVRWLGTIAHNDLPEAANALIKTPGTVKALFEQHLLGVPSLEAAAAVLAYREGRSQSVLVTRRERDPAARAACLEHYKPICTVCQVDMRLRYRGVARDLMHVHHLDPLGGSEGEREVDPVKDLRPLCPNCHSAAHARTPPFSMDDLRAMLH